MNLNDFIIMRHELLLTTVIIILLIAEVFSIFEKGEKSISEFSFGIEMFAILLFLIITLVGFVPSGRGMLFGGMYQTDEIRILMKNILNIGTLIILFQSVSYLRKNENKEKSTEFILLLFSTLLGMNFMVSSGDFLMFYLGLELATLPLAALAAFDKFKNKFSEAGIKFILLAALSSGVTLYGISMIYGTNGSIYFSDVSLTFSDEGLQILAFIFFISGLAFKISLVPFHFWAADVYEGAPVNITSYLSVISKGAAVFIFIILLYHVFPVISKEWTYLLYALSILTMTIGNLFAIRQQNLKRFLAFSSIAQAGFILLGVIGEPQLGLASVIYFVLIYVFSNLGAFGVVSAISNFSGKENMNDYNGLYQTNPKLSLVLMLSLFSLAGIPPVAGFFGKFFLFTAAAQKGFYGLVIIATLNATISLYYYLLVIKAMFINKNEQPVEYFRNDFFTRTGLLICVLGMIIIGFASFIFDGIFSMS